jgi:hypothetical protein
MAGGLFFEPTTDEHGQNRGLLDEWIDGLLARAPPHFNPYIRPSTQPAGF